MKQFLITLLYTVLLYSKLFGQDISNCEKIYSSILNTLNNQNEYVKISENDSIKVNYHFCIYDKLIDVKIFDINWFINTFSHQVFPLSANKSNYKSDTLKTIISCKLTNDVYYSICNSDSICFNDIKKKSLNPFRLTFSNVLFYKQNYALVYIFYTKGIGISTNNVFTFLLKSCNGNWEVINTGFSAR